MESWIPDHIHAIATNRYCHWRYSDWWHSSHVDLPFFFRHGHGIKVTHHFSIETGQPHATHPSVVTKHTAAPRAIVQNRHNHCYERGSVVTLEACKRSTSKPLVWAIINVVAIRPKCRDLSSSSHPGTIYPAVRPWLLELASSTMGAAHRQQLFSAGPWKGCEMGIK